MDLHRIDLNLLVSLDALLTERNVTRAAKRLGLSQSALSAQLVHLRRIFGDPLLIPQARGVLPTNRALALVAPLKDVLSTLEAFVVTNSSFEPASTSITLRVAMHDAHQAVLGIPLMKHLRKRAPGLRIAVLRADFANLDREFEANRLDFVVVTPQHLQPHWHTHLLFRDHFVCVVRRGHPAARRKFDLAAFCALEHIVISPPGGVFVGPVDGLLANMGRRRNVKLSVQDFLIALRTIRETNLVLTVPASVVKAIADDGLIVLPPPLTVPSVEMHLGWHERSHADPAQQWIRSEIVELAKSL